MAAFPSTIACVVSDNYKEEFPVTKRYLGGETYTRKPTATVTASIATHADMAAFTTWYVSTINNGLSNFTLDVPFFGTRKNWNVRLINPLSTSTIGKVTHLRSIQLKVEILDSI